MFVERESLASEIVQAPELIMSQNYSYRCAQHKDLWHWEMAIFHSWAWTSLLLENVYCGNGNGGT